MSKTEIIEKSKDNDARKMEPRKETGDALIVM